MSHHAPQNHPVIFMGTPQFAVPSLLALYNQGYPIKAVFTQPPKPKGRGLTILKTPVHQAAEELKCTIYTPSHLDTESLSLIQNLHPSLIIVAAYGHILPSSVLRAPAFGCLNLHASLLPRWRGASPLQQALLSGDAYTGVSLMHMDKGMDTGPVYVKEKLKMHPQENLITLDEKLSLLAAHMLNTYLPSLLNKQMTPLAQDTQGITLAPKVKTGDAKIVWQRPLAAIERHIRAFYPKAFFSFQGKRIRLLKATRTSEKFENTASPCLTVFNKQLFINLTEGALRIDMLQPEGKKAMDALTFLNGYQRLEGQKPMLIS